MAQRTIERGNDVQLHNVLARHSSMIGMIMGGLLLLVFMTPPAKAQTCSPYSDFQAMTLTQLQTLQVKLTFVGIQDKGVPSVGFTSATQPFDVTLFQSFQRSTVDYSNDQKVNTFVATPSELQAVIAG